MSLTLALTALGFSAATSALAHRRQETASLNFQACPEFNANISASIGGQGTPFECATLDVPLDYTNASSGTLQLELFRVNATREPVLGTVLINFGGPGGTGAENLPAYAELAHELIGEQWNLVSWDPRGTGNTIPFRCDLEAALGVDPDPTTANKKRDLSPLVSTNLTEFYLNGGWELVGELADFCTQEQTDGGEAATLIGTAFVARDMMQIVDALGEDGLLRYYGWSYGTALGSYVAAMFPDRVERMVLDGNVNPHAYQAGDYGDMAIDIDEAFEGFVQTCFDAGDDCALFELLQPDTPQAMVDAANVVLAPLAQNASTSPEAYVNWMTLKGIIIPPLYFPANWPSFATTLAALLNNTVPPAPVQRPVYGTADNAVIGIRAGDATFHANTSEEYLPIVEHQATVSPGFSDVAYTTLWVSARWTMPAKERYWGDFNVRTKTPILYVNGEFDPVTPLVNAYNGSASFQGSAVLPHSGYGHGYFASPSRCVAERVRAYYENGTLPGPDVRCEPDATTLEVFQAVVQASNNGSSSTGGGGGNGTTPNSNDNSTSDGQGDGNGDGNGNGTSGQSSPNGANRMGSGATLLFGTVLAVAVMTLL